eukprot:CAMPEP_0117500118 /NCGR_PEP_ID=MMETSP0784-20121206/22606_1 /TAXON_ID=39447 /ORGANISM="" /LENGTH=267 /DNA_ID=CAMNT_0005295307 /DNA_START=438 /DNA_END=1240 /DNA_ORIENTATION=-
MKFFGTSRMATEAFVKSTNSCGSTKFCNGCAYLIRLKSSKSVGFRNKEMAIPPDDRIAPPRVPDPKTPVYGLDEVLHLRRPPPLHAHDLEIVVHHSDRVAFLGPERPIALGEPWLNLVLGRVLRGEVIKALRVLRVLGARAVIAIGFPFDSHSGKRIMLERREQCAVVIHPHVIVELPHSGVVDEAPNVPADHVGVTRVPPLLVDERARNLFLVDWDAGEIWNEDPLQLAVGRGGNVVALHLDVGKYEHRIQLAQAVAAAEILFQEA